MNQQLTLILFGPKFRSRRFYGAFILYALIIGIGMIPDARAQAGVVASGLVLHSIAYASITFLLVTGSTRSRTGQSVQAVLLVLMMGAFDEYVQSFFPYRNAAISDWIVDCFAGLVTATLLYIGQPMMRNCLAPTAPVAPTPSTPSMSAAAPTSPAKKGRRSGQ